MTTDTASLSPIKRAIVEIRELRAKLEALEQAASEPIAIVGLGCRVPGADGPDAFWRLLREGVDAIGTVPPDRWDVDAFYDPDPDAPGKMYTRRGGFLDRVDGFDAALFGVSPREAASMDPQQRLLLEVAWEALEQAGIAPDTLAGVRGGVFVGIASSDYASFHYTGSTADIDAYFGTGNALSVAAGRLSYFLGLQGPSMAIDTACSSSLVAVHVAAQSLRQNECRVALAGGVNLMLRPESTVNFCRARMLAADGRCKTFDAAADGYSRGEGAGMLVLKRLSHAIEDGDRVLALVLGSAVNQDGRSSGLTVPNGPSQESLIRDALARARIAPAAVGYVEAHGTGTPLGDPIELHALAAVLGDERPADDPVVIGSVKTNIGHLEAAAGVAGLIKVVLALQHETIPPHLHFHRLNPHIDTAACPMVVPAAARPWPRGPRRRVAGVSAFGFSGTNAHVVIAEAPAAAAAESKAAPGGPELVVMSARTAGALRALAGRLAAAFESRPSPSLSDVAFTTATGRAHLATRLSLVVDSIDDLRARLRGIADGAAALLEPLPSLDAADVGFVFPEASAPPAAVVPVLSGQSMAFRDAFARCAAILDSQCGAGWRDWLDDVGRDGRRNAADLDAAAFALQYSHAALWRSWGVEPIAVGGYGVGECVAAAVAGLCSLETAIGLMRARATGAFLPAGAASRAVETQAPDLMILSPVDGRPLTHDRAREADYWLRPADAERDRDAIVQGLADRGAVVRVSLGITRSPAPGAGARDVLAWEPEQTPRSALLALAGSAYVRGVAMDWRRVFADRAARRIALPTYPFERRRHWLERPHGHAVPLPVPAGDAAVEPGTVDGGQPGAGALAFVQQVRDALPGERDELLIDFVREHVERVLRLSDGEAVGPRQRLVDLGVDSLMAVELQKRLSAGLGTEPLPATLIFDYPTVEAIAAYLRTDVLQLDAPVATDAVDESAAHAVADLSDEEVEALLLERLKDL